MLVSSVPFWVLIIVVAAGIISADKTLKAFQGAAAHQDWHMVVGWAGVAMAEVGMVYLAFASRADRLHGGDVRRVTTLVGVLRALAVRVGVKPPLPYSSLPETQRGTLMTVLFLLALVGNVYGVAFDELASLEFAQSATVVDFFVHLLNSPFAVAAPVLFKIFLGAVAPLALLVAGEELARVVFETRQRYETDFLEDEREAWRKRLLGEYERYRQQREAEALAKAYQAKNGLPPGAPTPYLLIATRSASGAEDGGGEITAVPLAPSQTHSLPPRVNP